MTIYSLGVLLFLFGSSLLFHVRFQLLLLDLHTGFLGGRSGGLVAPIFRHYIFSKKGIGRLKERSVFKYLKDYHMRGRLDLYFGFYKFNQKQGSHKRALVWKSNRPEYTSTGPLTSYDLGMTYSIKSRCVHL